MSIKTSISWADCCINPISGCRNSCPYCYAARFARRLAGRCGYPADDPFQPTFHPDKLDDIRKLRGKGKRIFLSSMADWFSEGMRPEWVHRIIQVVHEKPEHHFLVLTKRPERIQEMLHCIDLLPNLWMGVSVTCQADVWRIRTLAEALPSPVHKFVSFEPLHGPVDPDLCEIEWIIIGGETGNRKCRVALRRQWLEELCDKANFANVPVFLKNGMCGPKPYGQYGGREELPEAML
jgi:protein gp37